MIRGALLFMLAAGSIPAQVSFDRILKANSEPQNWLRYSGTTLSQRHSLLTQITPANVKNLELAWAYQAHSLEKYEATSIVADGILYTVQPPNDIVALDAATGRVYWTYSYTPSKDSRPCCGRVNRGVAILGDTLFMGTIDGHLVAIDARNGKPVWNTQVAKAAAGYAITHAPLVVKDKVIVGTAGGEYGIRGFIAAYDAKTGKEVWRFHNIPEPGEPGHQTWAGDSWKNGGGSVWVTGSYDPDLNLTYWGIGNPGPDWNGDNRKGDNLYTDSVVALDGETGKLKWHFQFSPHDEFDYDSVQIPVLVDMEWQGRMRKVMLWANRNGYFYAIDRTDGRFLLGKPFVKVNWATGLDERGRPMKATTASTSEEGVLIYPGNQGGTNWYNSSYSPRTGLFYIPSWVEYNTVYFKIPQEFHEGKTYGGGVLRPNVGQRRATLTRLEESEGYGAVRAVDPKTGDLKWEFKMADVTDAGILTTASDLLFTGGREGYFFGLDARNGELLWKATVGGMVQSGPMTYSVNGRQYVAVAAGNALFSFALKQ